MSDFIQAFEDRVKEIEAYLLLLDVFDQEVKTHGVPRIGTAGAVVTEQQQRILYSGVYLQLYNLVEATVTHCLEAVTTAIENAWFPIDLSDELRREWVRVVARTHIILNHDNRLQAAFTLFEHLIQANPVPAGFKVDKGAGGNWDDNAIQDISVRMGCPLNVSQPVYSKIKRKFRDDKGPLEFIKSLRNDLAHGTVSFEECGQSITVQELHELKNNAVDYLREVVTCFKGFIDNHEYLQMHRRPTNPGATSTTV